VTDKDSHVARLRDALKDRPDREQWIKEHLKQLEKTEKDNRFRFYARYSDYEALRGLSKEAFLINAYQLASIGRPEVEVAYWHDIGEEADLAHEQPNYKKFGI